MRYLLLGLLWLLGGLRAWAQHEGVSRAFAVNYTQAVYKAARQNWSATADTLGNTFFANNSGVLCFDGVQWKSIPLGENKVVRSVLMDNQNRLFVGAFEEFGFIENWNGTQAHYTRLSDSIPATALHNMEFWRVVQRGKLFYFQSFGTVFMWDGKQVSKLSLPASPVLLMPTPDALYVHLVGKGVYEIVGTELRAIAATAPLAHDEVKTVVSIGKDSLLLGAARGGLFLLTNKQKLEAWQADKADEVAAAELNAALRIGHKIIVGTIMHGLYVFDTQGHLLQQLNTDNALYNNTVTALLDDHRGNFWATLDDGMAYVRMNDPLDFYLSSLASRRSVYDAAMYNGYLWVGTNQGLFRYDFQAATGFSNPQFVAGTQGQVWDLMVVDGQLLCGHNTGTYRIEGLKAVAISEVHGGFCMQRVLWGGYERLLQSTYNELVLYRVKPKVRMEHKLEGFREPVPSIAIDHMGTVWAAHLHRGVYQLKLNASFDTVLSRKFWDKRSGLLHDSRVSVAMVDGRVVFATGRLLYTYDDLKDSIVPYHFLNDKLGEYRQAERIIDGGDGRYWAVAQNNVMLFGLHQNEFAVHFRYDLARQGAYNTTLYPNVANIGAQGYLIGLDNGFAVYRGLSASTQSANKAIIRSVVSLNYNHQEVALIQNNTTPQLAYRFNSIRFNFSPREHLVAPWFRYRLMGYDTVWTAWTENYRALYERLPAGNYCFELQMKDITGLRSPTEQYCFRVLPPWYLSKLAILLYAVLFIGLAFVLRRYIKRRIHIQANRLTQQELEERNRKQMLEEQMRIRQNNKLLQDEVNHQNAELANYSLLQSRQNELVAELREEILRRRKELGNRLPKNFWQRLMQLAEAMDNKHDAWDAFELHFDRVNDQYVQRLKAQYPELTQSDLRLCVLLRLNLNTKEIAPLLNITVRGVEIRRYRLRKRLGLNSDDNLTEFLLQF